MGEGQRGWASWPHEPSALRPASDPGRGLSAGIRSGGWLPGGVGPTTESKRVLRWGQGPRTGVGDVLYLLCVTLSRNNTALHSASC